MSEQAETWPVSISRCCVRSLLERRVTDKMPFNSLLLGLIRQVLPNATIVHCRRHPIDTYLSIFTTELVTRYEFAADCGDLAFAYRDIYG